jgi:Uma2 family endonuclease
MPLADPRTRLWTQDEFHRMAELGFFDGQRAELIEGEVVVLSPQKALHFTATDQAAELLRQSFGAGYHVRMQGPLDFGRHSEPEPDVAVVKGARASYRRRHPRTAVLVVEVSDTTLHSDRTRKAGLYARAGVADYWIINLVDRRLEVYRRPAADPEKPYGHGYRNATVLTAGQTVSPLAAPSIKLAVADLFP